MPNAPKQVDRPNRRAERPSDHNLNPGSEQERRPNPRRRPMPEQDPRRRRNPPQGQGRGQNMVVTVLGFVGVAVLVILSVLFVRAITGQQSAPAPKAPTTQTTSDNNTTTNQGQTRVEDWETVSEAPPAAPEPAAEAVEEQQ